MDRLLAKKSPFWAPWLSTPSMWWDRCSWCPLRLGSWRRRSEPEVCSCCLRFCTSDTSSEIKVLHLLSPHWDHIMYKSTDLCQLWLYYTDLMNLTHLCIVHKRSSTKPSPTLGEPTPWGSLLIVKIGWWVSPAHGRMTSWKSSELVSRSWGQPSRILRLVCLEWHGGEWGFWVAQRKTSVGIIKKSTMTILLPM